MLKVIDLFAGAGGFGLGFDLAGYHLTHSLEIDKWAAETLRVNNPQTEVIECDIKEFTTLSAIRSACNLTPDVLIGGPPCQGFTVAGPAQKDPKDPRNSLFKEFARWVEALSPPMFVMENVKGILSHRNADGKKVIEIIKETFGELDYNVEVWTLNAAHYGVPQMRDRVFIVGNRLGFDMIGIPVPTHASSNQNSCCQMTLQSANLVSHSVTVEEAISDLPEISAGEGYEEQAYISLPKTSYQLWARGNQEVLFNHVAMRHTERLVERFRHISWGQSGLDVPEELGARQRSSNGETSKAYYHSNNRRLRPDRPSNTVPAHFYSSFVHPYQHRNLTAREAARIQSFPDSYRFMGKRTVVSKKLLRKHGRYSEDHLSQYNQIGNAVPPLLAKAIAEHLRIYLQNGDLIHTQRLDKA